MAGTLQFNNMSTTQTQIETEVSSLPAQIAGYIITEQISSENENIYCVAEKNGEKFFLKIYSFPLSPMMSMRLEKLKNVFSENVVHVVEYGDYEGRAFEVQKHCSASSLEGRKLSLAEIALNAVPQINKALQDIHSINIVHNDIKPENILSADGQYLLTDFGITGSDEGASGYTPEFASPEVLQTGFSTTLSDYYSFGVSLYVLFTSFNPFIGLSTEQQLNLKLSGEWIERSFLTAELYTLIEGLCHTNIELRWRYDHINVWCNAMKNRDLSLLQPEYTGEFGSFSLNGRVYSAQEQHELVYDLLSKWNTGFISDHSNNIKLKAFSSVLAQAFEQSESITDVNQRLIYFAYYLPFTLDKIFWKGTQYDSVEELAVKMLNECFDCFRLKKNINDETTFTHEIIDKRVISRYMKILGKYSKEQISIVSKLECEYARSCTFNSADGALGDALRICYKVSGSKELPLPGGSVSSSHQLRNVFVRLLNGGNVKAFNEFINFVCDENGKTAIPVAIWQEQLT